MNTYLNGCAAIDEAIKFHKIQKIHKFLDIFFFPNVNVRMVENPCGPLGILGDIAIDIYIISIDTLFNARTLSHIHIGRIIDIRIAS